jgi:hypothetical protein
VRRRGVIAPAISSRLTERPRRALREDERGHELHGLELNARANALSEISRMSDVAIYGRSSRHAPDGAT